MESLHTEIINLVAVIIAGCVGAVARYLVSYLKKKGIMSKIESHKELAKIAVTAVEQTYKNLHGEEKLNLAKIELIKMAKSKGVKISENDLDVIIESAVKEMNNAIKQ